MTTDRCGDFDARRVGWWQRRTAVRSIRTAAGITPADRDLRIQSAKAAQTRGDLNALTRDLGTHVAATPPASYSPPSYTPPPSYTGPVHAPPSYSPPSSTPPTYVPPRQQVRPPRTSATPLSPTPKKSFGRPLLIGLVVVFALIGGSVVSCVSTLVDTVTEISSRSDFTRSPSQRAADLQTTAGWGQMVRDLDEEVGVQENTTGLAVHGGAATLSTVETGDDGAADREGRYYYSGGEVMTLEPGERSSGQPFDLTAVSAAIVTQTVNLACVRAGATDPSESWVTIIDSGDGPRITVKVPDDRDTSTGTFTLVVDMDGNEIGSTGL